VKNLINISLIFAVSAFFYSCADSGSTVTPGPGNPLKGFFVLYEGFTSKTDYAYYDVSSGNLMNDVYNANNSGNFMELNPGDMKINSNRYLYITCRGTNSLNGKVFKIDAENNHLVNFITYGTNPYGFTINNNDLIVSNLGSNYVTRLDINLNVIRDSIFTGPMPIHVLYGFNKFIVSKSSLAGEQSLASINEINFDVTKYYFDFPPVSSTYNVNGYFISSYTRKIIYRLDENDFHKVDSILLPTSFGYIGEIIKKTGTTFYVVAGNKELWEVSSSGSQLSASIKIPQVNGVTILGAAYEESRNEIYIADNNDGLVNGELHIFDASNSQIKNSIPLGGRNPKRLAFRY